MDVSINPNVFDAANQVLELLGSGLQTAQGVHIGTLISAAGRLAGTSLFHSFHYSREEAVPGTAVLSEQANQQTSMLIGMLLAILKENGIRVKERDMVVKTPPVYAPQVDCMQIQQRFLKPFMEIKSKSNLDDLEAAYAATMACAMIVKGSSSRLDPRIACGIAAFSIIEGAKTIPILLAP